MRIVSLFFPTWCVDIHRRRSEKPTVFTFAYQGKQLIARYSRDAAQAGVTLGMNLTNAKALLPELEVFPFSPQEELSALEQCAAWAYRFSPIVAPDAAPHQSTPWNIRDLRCNGINLDITGCERLFQGEENLLEKLCSQIEASGVRCRAAVTPTLGASWALSRYRRERIVSIQKDELKKNLFPLPAASLRISPKVEQALRDVNIRTVEELLRLPRRQLAERFGEELLQSIDRAFGALAEPIEALRLRILSTVERTFAGAVSDLEVIKLAAAELVEELLQKLLKRQERPSQISIRLKGGDGSMVSKEVKLSVSSFHERHISRLVEKKLEHLQTPYGIEQIRLIAARTEHAEPETRDYLSVHSTNREGEQQLGELLDTLLSQLGSDRVLRVEGAASHLPERSFRYRSAGEGKKSEIPLPSTERPSILLSLPQRIRAMASLPDGPPFWVKWREQTYSITSAVGPERISSEWWKQSGETRDYFKVQLPTGTWLWIYRECESSNWFLHGLWV